MIIWHPTKGLREGRADQFSADDGWIHDLSAVSGPIKYWKAVAGAAVMMGKAEIDAVDAQEVAVALAADQTANRARIDDERILKALALVMLDQINVLRVKAGLVEATPAQLLNAIKTKVGEI